MNGKTGERSTWKVVTALMVAVGFITFSNALIVLTLSLNQITGENTKINTSVLSQGTAAERGSALERKQNVLSQISTRNQINVTSFQAGLDGLKNDFSELEGIAATIDSGKLTNALEKIHEILEEQAATDFLGRRDESVKYIEAWIAELKYWRDALAGGCGIAQIYAIENTCVNFSRVSGGTGTSVGNNIKKPVSPVGADDQICFGGYAEAVKTCPYPDFATKPYDDEVVRLMDDLIKELEEIRDAMAGIIMDADTCPIDESENKYEAVIEKCYESGDDFSEVTDALITEFNKYKGNYIIRFSAIHVSSVLVPIEKITDSIEMILSGTDNIFFAVEDALIQYVMETWGIDVEEVIREIIPDIGIDEFIEGLKLAIDQRIAEIEQELVSERAKLEPSQQCGYQYQNRKWVYVCTDHPTEEERLEAENNIAKLETLIEQYGAVKNDTETMSNIYESSVMQNFAESTNTLNEMIDKLKEYGLEGNMRSEDVDVYLQGLKETIKEVTPSIAESMKQIDAGLVNLYDGEREQDIQDGGDFVSYADRVVKNLGNIEGSYGEEPLAFEVDLGSIPLLKGIEDQINAYIRDNLSYAMLLKGTADTIVTSVNGIYAVIDPLKALASQITQSILEAFESMVEYLEDFSENLASGFEQFVQTVLDPFLDRSLDVLECIEEIAETYASCKIDKSSCPEDFSELCQNLRG